MADTKQQSGVAASGVKRAEAIDTSGAPQQIVPDVDMTHPAVDADPRADTTAVQNRIDFNDPRLSGSESVAQALTAQGVPTKDGAEAAASIKAQKN